MFKTLLTLYLLVTAMPTLATTLERLIVITIDGQQRFENAKAIHELPLPKGMAAIWGEQLGGVASTESAALWAALFSSAGPALTGVNSPLAASSNRIATIFSVFKAQHPNRFTLAGGNMLAPATRLALQGDGFDYRFDVTEKTNAGKGNAEVNQQLMNAISDPMFDFGLLFGHYQSGDENINVRLKKIIDAVGDSANPAQTLIAISTVISTVMPTTSNQTLTLTLIGPDSHIKGGKQNGELAIIDVAPTLALLLGLKVPQAWQGKPLNEAIVRPESQMKLLTVNRNISAAFGSFEPKNNDQRNNFLLGGNRLMRFVFGTSKSPESLPIMAPDYPQRIRSQFYGINFDIDAGFYRLRPSGHKIYLFKDRQYYRYSVVEKTLDKGYPTSLNPFGLSKNWQQVDAAFNNLSRSNRQVYFFNGQMMDSYGLDSFTYGSERPITTMFKGWNSNKTIDAAIAQKATDGRLYTYFFSGNDYYVFAATNENADAYVKIQGPTSIAAATDQHWRGLQLHRY